MITNSKAYNNFMETLVKLGIEYSDLVPDDNGRLFYFMRLREFNFCDKYGKFKHE